ncbi:uncharacterized protein [Pleurodeles waltl]|uniref:uncharacterized protein n=1 Tax=Pleurodeles waltl TaxID=8319 RepID=UPI0037098125
MAEVSMASDSDDELALEVLSGFVKTVYDTVKDETVSSNDSVAKPATPVKSEKVKERDPFQQLLFRAAQELNIENTVVEQDKPRSGSDAPGQERLVIPLDSDIAEQCHTVWQKPASVMTVDWGMQRKYRGRGDGNILTIAHPPADSVVVFAASGGRTTKAENFPIPGKEAKSLDAIGKRIYQAGGLGLKEANAAAIINRYHQYLWSQLSEIVEAVPEEEKAKVLEVQKEGLAVVSSSTQAAHDQADVSARTMATGILKRRRVWFGISGIPPQVENKVLDLPFDGSNLFHSSTEDVIERSKKEPPKSNVTRRVNFLRRQNKVIRRKATQPKV